jgi:hypothetical protein
MGSKSSQVDAPAGDSSVDEANVERAKLRGEINAKRDEMSQTVGQIEQKLNPERLKNEAIGQFEDAKQKIKAELREEFAQARDKVREEFEQAKDAVREATIGKVEHMARDVRDTVSETRSNIVETIKANPVPAVLAGLSIAWLFINRQTKTSSYNDWQTPRASDGRRGARREALGNGVNGDNGWRSGIQNGADAVGNAVHDARAKANDLAHQVQRRAGEVAHEVSETAGRLATQTQERVGEMTDLAVREVRTVETYLSRQMRENPVTVGAVVLALGAAAGLALPRTQVEDQLMGETRDALTDRAGELAHGAVHKAQEAVQEVANKIS